VAILLAPRGGSIFAVNGGEIGKESQIALLPGRHTVTLKEGTRGVVLCFDAEAGHSYQVRIYSGERNIVDLTTMEPVGESLPAPVGGEHGENQRIRDKDGYWKYIIRSGWQIGKIFNEEIVTYTLSLAEFGKDLAEKFRWGLNAMGFILIDVSGKLVPSQHVRMSFGRRPSGPEDPELFVGDGTPVIRFDQGLFVRNRSYRDNLLELINMSPSQMKEISGLAQKIGQGFSEQGVTRIVKSIFCFTHADGGDFFSVLTVRDRDNNKQILIFSEKE
jgi:hypothetical protein